MAAAWRTLRLLVQQASVSEMVVSATWPSHLAPGQILFRCLQIRKNWPE